MIHLKKVSLAILFIALAFSCKETAKGQETIDKELEQIEAVEQTIDSTVTTVHQKAEELEELLKDLDSI